MNKCVIYPFVLRFTAVTVVADGLSEGGHSIAKRGPKTENGKKASSRNAVKHGLRMTGPIIRGLEEHADWQRHLEGITDSLDPEGYHECVLVERIAMLIWRSRRAVFYELARIDDLQASAEYDTRIAEAIRRGILAPSLEAGVLPEVDEVEVDAAKARRILPSGDDLMLIMRYEAHLHRMYIQTLHELEAIQARRRGERVPLARLDISGPPAG